MTAKIIILGVGNILLSDDGVGIHLLTYLRTEYFDLPNVIYLDGGVLGLNLAAWINDADGLLILDAAELKGVPGTVKTFMGNDIDTLRTKCGRSAHDFRILDMLTVGKILGITLKYRAVVAIQYQNIDWGLELSDTVKQALPVAAFKVCEIIKQWQQEEVKNVISANSW